MVVITAHLRSKSIIVRFKLDPQGRRCRTPSNDLTASRESGCEAFSALNMNGMCAMRVGVCVYVSGIPNAVIAGEAHLHALACGLRDDVAALKCNMELDKVCTAKDEALRWANFWRAVACRLHDGGQMQPAALNWTLFGGTEITHPPETLQACGRMAGDEPSHACCGVLSSCLCHESSPSSPRSASLSLLSGCYHFLPLACDDYPLFAPPPTQRYQTLQS
jgi:hypothetical protein